MSNSQIEKRNFEIVQHNKTALLFGASGLVGGHILKQLCKHQAYSKVISFGRKILSANHPKLIQHKIDFDKLDEYSHLLKGNDLFLCIGTTIKKAGSKEAFRKIDYQINFNIAKLSSLNDVSQLVLVSAVGADPDSMFFYSQVKGALERDIKKLPFWSTHIIQPSILLGNRDESRPLESVAIRLGRGLKSTIGSVFGKYNPIEAETVAKAMVQSAQQFTSGNFTYRSPKIEELASKELND